MRNILLLINQLHTGGAEKVVARLSGELGKRYNIFIVTFNRSDTMFNHAGEHIFIQLPFSRNPSANNLFARFIRFLVLILRLRKIKKTKGIHTSISFLEAANVVNLLSRRKEKVIVSVRSHLSSEFKDDKRLYIFKTLIRNLYNRAYCIVVPSKLIGNDLIRNFAVNQNRLSVIYNFIDHLQIRREAEEKIPAEIERILVSYPTLINIGRLTNPKGQEYLFPILRGIKETVPDIKLIILGDGPLKDKLLAAAVKSGLRVCDAAHSKELSGDYDIYMLGFTANPFPYLTKSTMLVSSSLYEGFPNAMIEAMACGLPVISSDCRSGPREILAPDTDINKIAVSTEYAAYGVLLPVFHESMKNTVEITSIWAEVMVDMLHDTEKRSEYAKKALARSSDFHKDAIIEKWINLIESGRQA